MTSGASLLQAFAIALCIACCTAQWAPQEDYRRRNLTRSLGIAARDAIDYIKAHENDYEDWLVNIVKTLKVSRYGFSSIETPDNVLELWDIMSQNPSHIRERINELTPHNLNMPEEEKLMCAIVARYIWDKLQKEQYRYQAGPESLTLVFALSYEELIPPYLAMSEYLSKGMRFKPIPRLTK